MKPSKVVHVPIPDVRQLNTIYDLYSSRIVKIERDFIASTYRRRSTNVSCQCNIRRDLTCTCRRLVNPETRYFSSPKQVYRYTDWRSFTDIGVGSVKALPRKRIRKIYLPETIDKGVGSANLSSYISGRSGQQWADSYYENKRTSSKCVGGFIENENVSLVNKQLSPIIQQKSGTTSPRSDVLRDPGVNTESNSLQNRKSSMSTQVNVEELNTKPQPKEISDVSKVKSNPASKQTVQTGATKEVLPTVAEKLKSAVINENTGTCKDYSSDSFVQHVHNLENPSDDKQSKISVDPMENKLEREYRKIFTSKSKERPSVDKPIPDFKSASLLRRRFEALRRGLGKKESKRDSILINKIPSQTSMPSRKDVSIASDPPSLEGRSYSNTKVYSPYQSTTNDYKPQEKISHKKSPKGKKIKDIPQWSPELGDSKYESVQGMFKLWGKKFNLDEENCKTSPTISNDVARSPEVLSKSESPPQAEFSKKKQGRKFFIFGKKTKDKENKPYKPKKGVTAGRCEVKDGLTIKMGGPDYSVKEPVKKQETHLEKYDNILRKGWLDKYITNTRDSRNSVHIRWNNKMYATSSSTILELMDSVYKHTGINFRSRSEITTGESSNYHSYTKQRVHFMHQDIEAWMIPKMITNKHQIQSIDSKQYHKNKCQRWFVDASKGFSQKIELVLRSKSNSKSSEYLIINIPEGYFSRSSSDLRAQSSDEKIYKIVEYDTPELRKIKETRHMATGDNLMTDTNLNDNEINNDDKQDDGLKIPDTDQGNIKTPSSLRDVAIQGSDVFVPKRCDVIGVGIITHRDIRDVRKQVMKIEDELTDDESEENHSVSQKKCELAESYLQDYCRNWMPSGIDMFSWQISDSQHSDNNSVASLSQGDGTKSYPNMYDNFQESTIVLSSCETSSCSHCIALEDDKKPDDSLKSKFLSKFKKKSSEVPLISDKRNCPKDSLEVYRRRQFYACTNQKCKWFLDDDESHSMPSIECKAKSPDNQKLNKPCWRIPNVSNKKKNKNAKHVSLPGCEEMTKLVDKLSDRTLEGILSYKGSACNKKGSNSPKRTGISPRLECQIPPPPCKETCVKEKKPPCTKKNSPPCDELFQPRVNIKSPIPPCEMKPVSPPPTPPICIKPVKKPPCSACYNPPRKMSSENLRQNCLAKTPSQQSGLSLKMSPRPSPKHSDACFPTTVNNTDKIKECKPNCANKKNLFNKLINTPPTPPPTAYHMPQTPDCTNNSNDKVTGLHLKKLPSKKKTSSDDCYDSDGPGVIRLNSQEKFTIRMKKETPSTEEIRESLNIKVQDEDGQTLYERIDYKQSGDTNKCLLLNDVYKDPQIRRVSTPITGEGVTTQNKSQSEVQEAKSECSVDNLIEINFTLKLKHGDKGTEVNITNAGDTEIKQKVEGKATESQKSIYIVQNQAQQEALAGNKKDVNIKIVIKNFKTDPEKYIETEMYAVHNADNDVFNKRISEKFQTVSTGYSDIDQHAFSIHRATVDLTASVDRYEVQSKFEEYATSNEIVNIPNTAVTSSHSVLERAVTDQTVNSVQCNKEEVSTEDTKKSSSNIDRDTVISYEDRDKFEGNKSGKCSTVPSINHAADTVNETSNESVLYKNIRLHNRAQKKAMLKKLFRSSSVVKKPENKKRIKEIIHAILTSDSSGTDIAVTSNELAKELTYASLDPAYFRDTDSMNNFYQRNSELSNCKESRHQKLNPTKNNSEYSDNESDVSSVENKKQGCLCSALATKLNISLNGGRNNCGCCCQGNVKIDEEINCDVGTDNCLLSPKTRMDVETQNSKHVLNKLNSANLSTHNKTQSIVLANTSVTIQNSIDHTTKRKSSKTYVPNLTDIKYYGMRRFNRETFLGLSDDDMLVLNSNVVKKTVSKRKKKKISKRVDSNHAAADILQLNETKKAVLEIYKEKIVLDEGEQLVAKLPKFHIQKDNDLSNYEDIVIGHRRVSKRNFVMMTINR